MIIIIIIKDISRVDEIQSNENVSNCQHRYMLQIYSDFK